MNYTITWRTVGFDRAFFLLFYNNIRGLDMVKRNDVTLSLRGIVNNLAARIFYISQADR